MKARSLFSSLLFLTAVTLLGCKVSPISNLVSQSAQTGSMRVSVRGDSPQRAVQARFADIDHLIVGVQTDYGTATQSLSSASASTTFDYLRPGIATVSVEAFSATESIGLATASATVRSLEITDVNISLTLATTYDYRGNIDIGIGIHDGLNAIFSPISTISVDAFPYSLQFAPNGTLYMYDHMNNKFYTVNTHDSSKALVQDCSHNLSGSFTIDASGNIYLTRDNVIYKNGEVFFTNIANVDGGNTNYIKSIAVDLSNNLYIGTHDYRIYKITSLGVATKLSQSDYYGGVLSVDDADNLYYYDDHSNIKKVDPSGTNSLFKDNSYLIRQNDHANAIAYDKHGHLLVSIGGTTYPDVVSISLIDGSVTWLYEDTDCNPDDGWNLGGLAVDANGFLYIGNFAHQSISMTSLPL